jgi:deferrochelatase/peroxidase EfeB
MLDPHLDCGEPGVEPFGFADGISQPVMDWDGKRRAGGDADQDYTNEINAGEVLLGYQNEYNLIGDRPLVPVDLPGADLLPSSIDDPDLNDLGRNGSFLVLRTLKQDYEGFWGWCEAAAGALRKQELAEAVVGRKKNGHPLDGLPRTDIRGVEDGELDGFTYDSDPEGHVCPFGGHIRRANPRMGDIPGGRKGLLHYLRVTLGFWGTIKDDSIAPSRYHRILRRGRPYGAKGHEQGLHFIALNANLTRQFEFVQGAWLANPNFATLADEADPLTGSREPYGGVRTDAFTRPREAGPNTRYEGLPRFVQVVGGGYFFLPGLRALKYIARAAG